MWEDLSFLLYFPLPPPPPLHDLIWVEITSEWPLIRSLLLGRLPRKLRDAPSYHSLRWKWGGDDDFFGMGGWGEGGGGGHRKTTTTNVTCSLHRVPQKFRRKITLLLQCNLPVVYAFIWYTLIFVAVLFICYTVLPVFFAKLCALLVSNFLHNEAPCNGCSSNTWYVALPPPSPPLPPPPQRVW